MFRDDATSAPQCAMLRTLIDSLMEAAFGTQNSTGNRMSRSPNGSINPASETKSLGSTPLPAGVICHSFNKQRAGLEMSGDARDGCLESSGVRIFKVQREYLKSTPTSRGQENKPKIHSFGTSEARQGAKFFPQSAGLLQMPLGVAVVMRRNLASAIGSAQTESLRPKQSDELGCA